MADTIGAQTTDSPHMIQARRVSAAFAAHPAVRAIALGGSQRRGVTDASSDLDLYIYTGASFPAAERRTIIDSLGPRLRETLDEPFWGPGDEWTDATTGVATDCIYFDCDWMEGDLRRRILEHQASLGYSTSFWHTVRNSLPLWDPQGWFARMQSLCATPYPEPLRAAIVTLNQPVLRAVIPSYANQIRKAVRRGDAVSANHRVAGLLASYFDVLFALNRQLHPGEKRLLERALALCPALPDSMAEDIGRVLRASGTADENLLDALNTLLDGFDTFVQLQGFDPSTGAALPLPPFGGKPRFG